MNKNLKIIVISLTAGILLFAGYLASFKYLKLAPEPRQIACTMEAKQCPDGSYVGRTGPRCEFAECPNVEPSMFDISGWQTYRNEKYGFLVKYPPIGDLQSIKVDGNDYSIRFQTNNGLGTMSDFYIINIDENKTNISLEGYILKFPCLADIFTKGQREDGVLFYKYDEYSQSGKNCEEPFSVSHFAKFKDSSEIFMFSPSPEIFGGYAYDNGLKTSDLSEKLFSTFKFIDKNGSDYRVGEYVELSANVRERVEDCGGGDKCANYLILTLPAAERIGVVQSARIEIGDGDCVEEDIATNDDVIIRGTIQKIVDGYGLIFSCGSSQTSVKKVR